MWAGPGQPLQLSGEGAGGCGRGRLSVTRTPVASAGVPGPPPPAARLQGAGGHRAVGQGVRDRPAVSTQGHRGCHGPDGPVLSARHRSTDDEGSTHRVTGTVTGSAWVLGSPRCLSVGHSPRWSQPQQGPHIPCCRGRRGRRQPGGEAPHRQQATGEGSVPAAWSTATPTVTLVPGEEGRSVTLAFLRRHLHGHPARQHLSGRWGSWSNCIAPGVLAPSLAPFPSLSQGLRRRFRAAPCPSQGA